MSLDISIRPVTAPTVTPVVQAPSQAANSAVPTDLPAGQSVTVADPAAAASNDAQAANASVSRQAYFDRDAASMVFQVLNAKTDAVVDQFPDQAVLRRRAYFHSLDVEKSSAPRVLPTDRTA
jgi:hypothetical protein